MGRWTLQVTERSITALPNETKFFEEGSARGDLEPQLDAWAAELTVGHDLPLQYLYRDAELVPDAPAALSGYGELTVGDRLWLTDAAQVTRIRSELPVPTWTRPPSSLAHDAREYCLLPMRSNKRQVADAAYWLVERIRGWAGTQKGAAIRLNLSHGVLQEMKALSGRAFDRKAAVGNQPLTAEQKSLLARMVELIVCRLHLYDVGEPVGEHLTLDRV